MRRLIPLAASIAVNVGLLSALQLDVYLAQAAPPGEVSITELAESASSTYAQAVSERVKDRSFRQAAIAAR